MRIYILSSSSVFLSTPSARRATPSFPHESTLLPISIHALREEGDVAEMVPQVPGQIFLSTPSARRATGSGHHDARRDAISIHALREEGD